jgi:hypothetical protein
MQKAFGILVILLGVWVGLEVYQNGTAGAFDGALVRFGLVDAPAGGELVDTTPGERAGARLREAYDAGWERGERAGDEGRAAQTGSAGDRTAARARGLAGR